MITIHFSQCCGVPAAIYQDARLTSVLSVINKRVAANEALLAQLKGDEVIITYDEHFVLMMMQAHREKKIQAKLVEWCDCNGTISSFEISLDDDGNMIGVMSHGFFNHRLKYLLR